MKNNLCIYIHWPWCKNICKYCDFYKFQEDTNLNYKEITKKYIRDLKSLKKYISNKTITAINIGGGTPSTMDVNLINNLKEFIFKNYKVSNSVQVSIEANPEDISNKKLKDFLYSGINRVCIEIQSFSNNDLQFLGKKHTKREAIDSIIRTSYFIENIGVDLIFGVPGNDRKNFEEQLYFLRDLPIKHISLYEFDYLSKKKTNFFSDRIFYEKTKKILKKRNFFPYEAHSFCLKGFESIYINSVLDMDNYIGIGPSSHGRVIFDNKMRLLTNTKNLKYWLYTKKNTFKSKVITNEKRLEEFLLLGLSKPNGISLNELKKITDNNISKYINKKNFAMLLKNNYLEKNNDRLFLSNKGVFLINNIISEILY